MILGDIVKVGKNYDCSEEELPEILGAQVCLFKIDHGKPFPFEGTMITGEFKGAKWLFTADELETI